VSPVANEAVEKAPKIPILASYPVRLRLVLYALVVKLHPDFFEISMKKTHHQNGNGFYHELFDTVAGWVTAEIGTIIEQRSEEKRLTDFEKSIWASFHTAIRQQQHQFLNSVPSKFNVREWITPSYIINEAIWPIVADATVLAIGKVLNGQAITDELIKERKEEIYNYALETAIHHIEQTQKQPMTIIDKLKKALGFNQDIPKLRQPK